MPAPSYIKPQWSAPTRVLALSSRRTGGHSEPPYASFNLAHHVGDAAARVASNRLLLQGMLPADSRVQWLSQVHGNTVVQAAHGDACPQADAVWTREAGLACAVLTADCLPVLMCSVQGDCVAAAHAGWRGLRAGVLEATVAAMDHEPDQLLAWLGPAIGPAAFEVGPEVRRAFLATAADEREAAAFAACFLPNAGDAERYHADICHLARLCLRRVGVTRVQGGEFCTHGQGKQFFSYRRDGVTGRMASLIMLRRL